MLGIYGKTNPDTVAIDQGLTENSVSAHHSIKSQLKFND